MPRKSNKNIKKNDEEQMKIDDEINEEKSQINNKEEEELDNEEDNKEENDEKNENEEKKKDKKSSKLIQSKTFKDLHKNLLNFGKLSSSSSYVSSKSSLSSSISSSNPIIKAQQKSSFYDGASIKSGMTGSDQTENLDKSNLGKGWFNLQPIRVTDELKNDLKLIEMRNYLDPKRFYKKTDKIDPTKIVGIGTVIAGRAARTNQTLTRKEQRTSIMEEVLADTSAKAYTKKTFKSIQDKKNNKIKAYKVGKKEKKVEARKNKRIKALY